MVPQSGHSAGGTRDRPDVRQAAVPRPGPPATLRAGACGVSLQSPAQPRQPDTLSYTSRPLQPLCPRLCDSSLKIQLGHHPLQRGPVPPTPRRLAPPPPPAMCVPLRFTSAILHVWVPHQTAISL